MKNLSPREERTKRRLLEFIYLSPNGRTKSEIVRNVSGRTQDIARLLKFLFKDGQLVRLGSGVKGDPFVYKVPTIGTSRDAETVENGELLL